MWDRRPELWHNTTQTTTMDSLNAHIDDAADGFRPWESRHVALASMGSITTEVDPEGLWATIEGGYSWQRWNLAIGLFTPPAHIRRVENPLMRLTGLTYPDYVAFFGNDHVEGPAGTNLTVPMGTPYFDHVGVMRYPSVAGGTLAQARFLELMSPPEPVLQVTQIHVPTTP